MDEISPFFISIVTTIAMDRLWPAAAGQAEAGLMGGDIAMVFATTAIRRSIRRLSLSTLIL